MMSKDCAVLNEPWGIMQKETGNVIEDAHEFSEESQSSSGFSSNSRGPLDCGASMPISQNVKDWNSVATNSIPFELRPYVMFFGRHALLPIDLTCCPPCTERKLSSHEYVLELQE